MGVHEKLIIQNFFSIKDFEWDIKGFNVLTGGMASGKSLALKLLYFCQQVFHQTIFLQPNLSKDKFYEDKYFDIISALFGKNFSSKNPSADFHNTVIKYEYTLSSEEKDNALDNTEFPLFGQPIPSIPVKFDLLATWNSQLNEFRWSSGYISKNLEKWQIFFDAPKTPDLLDTIKNSIYSSILSDFSSTFPLASIFIPASRAIVAIADRVSSQDEYMNNFMRFKNFVLEFDNISNNVVNSILRVKDITTDKNGQPEFELLDGRKITSLELSSGQQELLYLLLIISDLEETSFKYGVPGSVFIEEPCAHLFPKEQKETMEFLVHYFNSLQNKKYNESGYRFFISTHSPYILNTVNNILEKARLLEKTKKVKTTETKNEILERIKGFSFKDLPIRNFSAYMIKDDGDVKSMINDDDDNQYIYSNIIDDIANDISDDAGKLLDINDSINDILRRKI